MAHHVFRREVALGGGGSGIGLPDYAGLTRIEWAVEDLAAFGDGGRIDTWTDRGSGAIEVTASGAARPTYRAAGTNLAGPVVEGDGTNKMSASGLSIDMTAGFTIFIVQDRVDSTSGNKGLLRGLTGGSSILESFWGGSLYALVNRGTTGSAFFRDFSPPNGKLLISQRVDASLGGNDFERRNGASTTGAKTGTPTMSGSLDTLELLNGFSTNLFDGTFTCLALFYGRAMTLTEVDEVEVELNTRYGVY